MNLIESVALAFPEAAYDEAVQITGEGELPSWFDVTGLATASMGIAGAALAAYGGAGTVTVHRRLASLWFGMTLQPIGWNLPSIWDSVAGDYETGDGWIRLHTNAPHHKAAALAVLSTGADRDDVDAAVRGWEALALETAIVEAGGCAAAMRSLDAWRDHPQGRAVRAEPLIDWQEHAASPVERAVDPDRPLAGIRVLDLTRVLAGPVATRFLAGFGANVLRIDPPDWDEPAVIPEVSLGKRCAGLDLREPDDRSRFEDLLATADILVHGYRPSALDGLGYDHATRLGLNPRLIDVSLDAYGWTGPWAGRRGFDSLVQMSSGIAQRGMERARATRPVPLPVQALDHATGYLMAASALHALSARREGRILRARHSLARTAALLTDHQRELENATPLEPASGDLAEAIEATFWGPARRWKFPLSGPGLHSTWRHPAGPLRRDAALWEEE